MNDQDIDRWAADWQGSAPATADLARMARREKRLLGAWIALDWLMGAALVAFAAWLWIDDGTPVMRFAAGGIVVLVAAVLAFTTVSWRGTLAGEAASATEFLALARSRSAARRRYIRFGWLVLAADLVIIAGVMLIEWRDEGIARLPSILGMTALAAGAAAIFLYVWGRRERRRGIDVGVELRCDARVVGVVDLGAFHSRLEGELWGEPVELLVRPDRARRPALDRPGVARDHALERRVQRLLGGVGLRRGGGTQRGDRLSRQDIEPRHRRRERLHAE